MNQHLLGIRIKLADLDVILAYLWCYVFYHGASFWTDFCVIRPCLTSSKCMEWEGWPGLSCVMSCKISLGEGRWGPIGVDLKLRRWSLRDFPEDLAVSKDVFIV